MEDDERAAIIAEIRTRYGGHKTTEFGERLLAFVEDAEDNAARLKKIDEKITEWGF